MSSTWIISNKSAGKGRHVDELAQFLHAHPKTENHSADKPGELQGILKAAREQGVERIGVSGGDGSIHHFFNALLVIKFRPTTFILPSGSANDFARSIGLVDWTAAVDAFENGSAKSFDVLKTSDDRHVINALTGGVSAFINERMTDEVKSFWGRFSYARVAAELITEAPNFITRVTIDGRRFETPVTAVIVANGRGAGGLDLVPKADPSDGLLDVVLVRATDLNKRLEALAMFAAGRQLESEHLEHVRGKSVKIEAGPPMPLMADGDEFGSTPVELTVVNRALSICVPS